MTTSVLPAETATAIGPMPGTDPAEAAAVVLGELPGFGHLPELPHRGVGADMIGRTSALLVDLATEVVPSGYRVTDREGRTHRRAVDLLRWDMDGLESAMQHAGATSPVMKTQFAGPWTLGAGIELRTGNRVLTDHGALREFTESMLEGLTAHVTELATRTGARVVVQLDEPDLPSVLAGALPTPSGYGTVPSVPEPEVRNLLASVIDAAETMTGAPVVVRCAGRRPPIALLRSAGAGAISVDATLLDGAPGSVLDEVGEAWDDGVVFLLGLVPARQPEFVPAIREVAAPALRLVDRLALPRDILAEKAIPTPTDGLAGCGQDWMRRALTLAGDVAKAFVDPPEEW